MPEPTNAADPNTSTDDGKNSAGAAAAGAGTQTAKTEDADKKFTQADLDALAAKTRREEKEKFERQQTKAQRDAEEAKAKEQGEFQKLADSRQKELDELRPKAERFDAYRDAVQKLAESELKALPDDVKEMAPSLDDPLAVLEWLPKGKKLADKLGGKGKPGHRADPPASGSSSIFDRIRNRKKEELERTQTTPRTLAEVAGRAPRA